MSRREQPTAESKRVMTSALGLDVQDFSEVESEEDELETEVLQ